jgi:hypothetical protein
MRCGSALGEDLAICPPRRARPATLMMVKSLSRFHCDFYLLSSVRSLRATICRFDTVIFPTYHPLT